MTQEKIDNNRVKKIHGQPAWSIKIDKAMKRQYRMMWHNGRLIFTIKPI